MKKRDESGWCRWLGVWMVVLFSMFLLNGSMAFADDCGVSNSDHPLNTAYFGDSVNGPFTNVSDGVKDQGQDLVWETDGSSESNTYTFEDACYFCQNMATVTGQKWRLPSVGELESLVDDSFSPATINDGYFTAQEALYWSSSVPDGYETNAFVVSFADGKTSVSAKTNGLAVRCVRNATDSSDLLSFDMVLSDATGVRTTIIENTSAAPGTNFWLTMPEEPEDADEDNPEKDDIAAGSTTSSYYWYLEVNAIDADGDKILDAVLTPLITSVQGLTTLDVVDGKATIYGTDFSTEIGYNDGEDNVADPINVDSLIQVTPTVEGTYTFTLTVWYYKDSYPVMQGTKSTSIYVCNDDCTVEIALEEYAPYFANDTQELILPTLFIQDKKESPTWRERLNVRGDLVMTLLSTPDNSLQFELQAVETSAVDKDGDGYTTDGSGTHSGEIDCDDDNPMINPGMIEIFNNRVDDDCDPMTFD